MFNNRRHLLLVFMLLFPALLFYSIPAMSTGVIGNQLAEYRFIPAATVLPYKNAGYSISESSDGVIHVKVTVAPLKNSTPYPAPIKNKRARMILDSERVLPMPAGLPAITHRLVQSCRGYFQAVDAILSWVTGHFRYQLENQTPLNGNCTAAAKLTVQMLSLAGIPARHVTGVMLKNKSCALSGHALHSFVEIYYPKTGWLFSDPLASYHFVPATYILLTGAPAPDYFGLILNRIRRPASLQTVITHDRSDIPGRINLFRFTVRRADGKKP